MLEDACACTFVMVEFQQGRQLNAIIQQPFVVFHVCLSLGELKIVISFS